MLCRVLSNTMFTNIFAFFKLVFYFNLWKVLDGPSESWIVHLAQTVQEKINQQDNEYNFFNNLYPKLCFLRCLLVLVHCISHTSRDEYDNGRVSTHTHHP